MKILQVLPELNAGGVERCVADLATHFVRRGDESLVVSNGGSMVPALEAAGVRHFKMPVHRKHPASLLQVRPLRRVLAAEQPDILHLHSRLPAWIAWLAWRGLPEATRPRFVTTVHGFYSTGRYSAIMTKGERIIAVSQSVERYVHENYRDTDPSRIVTIPDGVDQKLFFEGHKPSASWRSNWENAHPEARDRLLLTLPGRLTRLKGHHDFIRIIGALKHLPVQGVIAGGADPKKAAYEKEIRQAAAEAGLQNRITFTGPCDNLRDILAASSVVLSLSSKPEAFGLTTLEALSLGVPVVGYDHGGVGEQLDAMLPSGKVQPGNWLAVAQRITDFLADRPVIETDRRYNLDRSLAATSDVYEYLAGSAKHLAHSRDNPVYEPVTAP
jgi:glycosyltransferase involved in cell wall biosynthesis